MVKKLKDFMHIIVITFAGCGGDYVLNGERNAAGEVLALKDLVLILTAIALVVKIVLMIIYRKKISE